MTSGPRSLRVGGRFFRLLARLLCVLLAVIGATPPLVLALSKTETVRQRASRYVSRLLAEELGVEATFRAEVQPLPPTIVVDELTVPSTDGKGDAVYVRRALVRPRLLPLLDGRLDVGDVVIEEPRIRVVLARGLPTNFALRLPAERPAKKGPTEIPLRTLRLVGGLIDVTVDDPRVSLLLLGVSLEASVHDAGSVIDAKLTVDSGKILRERASAGGAVSLGGLSVDEDSLCSLGISLQLKESGFLVRSATLVARLDKDPATGTAPSCGDEVDPESRLSASLAQVWIRPEPTGPPRVDGHVELSAPVRLVHRFVPDVPSLTGSAAVELDVAYRPSRPLPDLSGKLRLREIILDHKRVLSHLTDAELQVKDGEVRVPTLLASYADADVKVTNIVAKVLEPGVPLHIDEIELRHLEFSGLMRDLGVTKHTHVQWHLDHGIARNFQGKAFDPVKKGPSLISDIDLQTSGFVLFDKGFDHPKRSRVIGVSKAHIKGRWGFEPIGCIFRGMTGETGLSHLVVPAITVGFDEIVEVVVAEGTRVDLADITPLVTIPLAGKVDVKGRVSGVQTDPRVEGDAKGVNIVMAGMPIADTLAMHVKARPILSQADFSEGHGTKGKSVYEVPSLHLDVGRPGGGALAEGRAEGKGMDLRDLLAITDFDKDPRFTDVKGTIDVRTAVRLDMGGEGDTCGGGFVEAHSSVTLGKLSVYGETYDGGSAELDFVWRDRLAAERGVEAVVRSVVVKKGRGTITGSGSVSQGGAVAGHFLASDIPLTSVEAMTFLPRGVDGSIEASGELAGFLDAWSAEADVRLTPLQLGRRSLPASRLHASVVPRARPEPTGQKTRCGNAVPAPFDLRAFAKDEAAGAYVLRGDLFGGQMSLDDVQMSRQRAKTVKGTVRFAGLDLGTFSELAPAALLGESQAQGAATGQLVLADFPLDHPERAEVSLALSSLDLTRDGQRLTLRDRAPGVPAPVLRVAKDALTMTPFALRVGSRGGLTADLEVSGGATHLASDQIMDLHIALAPTDLASLAGTFPAVEVALGTVDGAFDLTGPLKSASPKGKLRVRDGSVKLRGMPTTMDALELELSIDEREARIRNATAQVGGGKLTLSARAPIRNLEVGVITGTLEVSDLRLPLAEGVDATVDATLAGAWTPPSLADPTFHKAKVSGDLSIVRFLYTRPIQLSASFDSLGKTRRQSVNLYDPSRDFVDVDVDIRAKRPLVFRNNVVEASVVLESDSLNLTGTNQRYGVRGALRVEKGGHLRLRSNDFEVQKGTIRFEDPTRVAPRVDLLATTDYRRYTSGGGATSGAARAGGAWRVSMHAYGDADDLKVDLTSEPGLAQEDIVLLLTIGMTRAELDQLQAGNLGATAAFEALSALSGASSAVKDAVPIIDDFRLGSAYSARTGRTEPTVTVGKRISDDVRANVMTGLTENRDVRSYLEWRLGPKTSVIGNYDNLNDVTSQGLGNLGTDFRVRVEF